MVLDNKRDPERSGTYRFRWHHAPSKGECGPAYKLVPPDFDAEKSFAASVSAGVNNDDNNKSSTSATNSKRKKKSPKHPHASDTYGDLDMAVKNEPHSEEYLAILARREESRKARETERARELEALPPITDDESADMRRKFLEDQERKDYALKEREMDEDNAEKLRKYKSQIQRRQERVTERIVGSSQKQKDATTSGNDKEAADANVADATSTRETTVEAKSEQKIPCTFPKTCENAFQRSPKPKGKSTASIKNRRAQQQLASDIELLERKFEEQDNKRLAS